MSNSMQRLIDLAVSESGFVFDPWSGNTFTVNATGLVLLAGLKEKVGREALIERLRDAFDVQPQADLERHLDEFMHELRVYEVVDKEFAP